MASLLVNVVVTILVLAALVGLIFGLYYGIISSSNSSSSSSGLPQPSTFLNRNFYIRAFPTTNSNYLRSITVGLAPILDDIQNPAIVWTLFNSTTVPGAYLISNRAQALRMTSTGIGGTINMTSGLGDLESYFIELVGTTGYRLKTFQGSYVLADSGGVDASGTQSNATVFSFVLLLQ